MRSATEYLSPVASFSSSIPEPASAAFQFFFSVKASSSELYEYAISSDKCFKAFQLPHLYEPSLVESAYWQYANISTALALDGSISERLTS